MSIWYKAQMLLNTKLVTWGWSKAVHSVHSCSSSPHHRGLSARSLHERHNTTKSEFRKKWRVYRRQSRTEGKKRLIEGGKPTEGVVELERERSRWRREKVLMMLKIGRWALTTLSVNHCNSFLSTYLSLCPPLAKPCPIPFSLSLAFHSSRLPH